MLNAFKTFEKIEIIIKKNNNEIRSVCVCVEYLLNDLYLNKNKVFRRKRRHFIF